MKSLGEVTTAEMKFSDNTLKLLEMLKLINTELSEIKFYKKDAVDDHSSSETALAKRSYEAITAHIESFFSSIKHFSEDDNIRLEIKKAFYEQIFNSSNNVELLFCPSKIDADLLLVCANRANRCKGKDRLLFICDTDFIRTISQMDISMSKVSNLGILHHYTTGKFILDGANKPVLSELLAPEVKDALTAVFSLVPGLIKDKIKNTQLKVVLRCCSGAAVAGTATKTTSKAYGIQILPPSIDFKPTTLREKYKSLTSKTNEGIREELFQNALSKLKDTTVLIKQDVKDGKYITHIYIPHRDPIRVEDFESLMAGTDGKEEQNFKKFATRFINWISQLNPHPNIDPYSISLLLESSLYGKDTKGSLDSGVSDFKKCFSRKEGLLSTWEKGKTDYPKAQVQRFFPTAQSANNTLSIPKNTYAGQLLEVIKGDFVAVFKTYTGGYVAYPDRMVHMSSSKEDIDELKAIIVSRDKGYMQAHEETIEDDTSSEIGANGPN